MSNPIDENVHDETVIDKISVTVCMWSSQANKYNKYKHQKSCSKSPDVSYVIPF